MTILAAIGVVLVLPCRVDAGEKIRPLAGARPNIILILTDDQGYGDLACHGNPIIKTPNIDRMFKESVRFTDFHVSPTCSPTRSSIMTDRHEFKNGITHTILERERMSLKATTIAQVLRTAGYVTGIFGKWHLGDEEAYRPDQRGFSEVFSHGAGGIGQTYPGSCGDAPGNKYFDPVILHNGKFEKTQGYCTDVFFAQASKWIESVKGKQPFFAYITPNAPHAPLVVGAKYEQMYAGIDVPKNGKAKGASDVAKFYGMITNIDENVGKLLEKLKDWGIEGETLVIFMNDNGGTVGVRVFNAGMRGGKVTPYNGGTRGISFWRWPGTLKAGDVDRLTAHIDLFPTFAQLAGAKLAPEVAQKLDGHSLLPLLSDAKAAWPDRMLFTHVGRWAAGADPRQSKYAACSVRWGPYNLVSPEKAKGNAKTWELYDLKADPGEKNNLAGKATEIVTKLDAAYDEWWKAVLPALENETAHRTAPRTNPFHQLYWQQYGGPGPNNVPPKKNADK
jgi:arylsulfatase